MKHIGNGQQGSKIIEMSRKEYRILVKVDQFWKGQLFSAHYAWGDEADIVTVGDISTPLTAFLTWLYLLDKANDLQQTINGLYHSIGAGELAKTKAADRSARHPLLQWFYRLGTG